MNDWTGNKKSIYTTLGASSHCTGEREVNDYYATDPKAVDYLIKEEAFCNRIWECACGEGHLAKRLMEKGYDVSATDLVYRGFGEKKSYDFLKSNEINVKEDIITNPPYKYSLEFVEKALEILDNGQKVAMFLKIQFLEGKNRRKLFNTHPPKTVYVSSSRIKCAKNGKFEEISSSAVAYGWFVWVKGAQIDNTILKWIN